MVFLPKKMKKHGCFTDGALLAGVPSFAAEDTRVGCLQRNERSHKTLLRCLSHSAQTQFQGTFLINPHQVFN